MGTPNLGVPTGVELYPSGLFDLKEVYLDGTKIEANANRYTFVWANTIKTNKAKISRQLEELWSYTQKVAKEELEDTSPTIITEKFPVSMFFFKVEMK